MRKIIPLRSLIGYSIIIGACSLILEANLQIYLDAISGRGYDLTHMSLNHIDYRLGTIHFIYWMSSIIFPTAIAASIIFICSAVSFYVEGQSSNFAKLLLIGATKWQVFRIFLISLIKPFSINTLIGTITGSLVSRFFSQEYANCSTTLKCDLHTEIYIPPLDILSIIYTCLITFGILIGAIIFSLKKFLAISPLSLSAGRYADASKISKIRITLAIIVTIYSIYWFNTAYNLDVESANTNYQILGGLELLNFYLYLPVILKAILPKFYSLLVWIFPIAGLFAKRTFHSTIRKYANLTAPIILCFMFTMTWFMASRGSKVETHEVVFKGNLPISAAAIRINPSNQNLLHHDLNLPASDKNAIAVPIRMDPRFAEENTHKSIYKSNVLNVLETDPTTIATMFHTQVTAGNLHLVHGTTVASGRDQDKIGDTITLISPSGKTIRAHVVAKIKTHEISEIVPIFRTYLIVDYASFPEAMTNFSTEFNSYYRNAIHDLFSHYGANNYTVIYYGVTADRLAQSDISAIPFNIWGQHFVDKYYTSIHAYHFMMALPMIIVCLAFVIVNSISFSGNSEYIRRVISLLGGTRWQDLRILFIQLTSIFILALILSPVPALLDMEMQTDYTKATAHINSPFIYPYQEMTIALIALLIAAFIPPLAKMLYLRKKPFSITS